MTRATMTLIAGLGVSLVLAACGDKTPPPAPAPLAATPEPEKITAENADAAADALEKELAADAD
jgi:hypothetical protein